MKTLVVAKDGKLSIQEVNKPRYNEYQEIGRASCRERV